MLDIKKSKEVISMHVIHKGKKVDIQLEYPKDVVEAIKLLEKMGEPVATFFVEGYPSIGQSDCEKLDKDFIREMEGAVGLECDIHVRVCRTL